MAEAVASRGRALEVVEQVRTRFVAMPQRRRTWLLGAVAGVVALVLLGTWYAGRPDWKVLFSGLEGKDIAQVSQELGAAGIPFQQTADGVEVPAELVDKARMEVAAKGMPASGRLGFELFDKPNWVGSEFDERVNYQRAMEGELEHTIATLGVVRSARVHLVLPKESLFAAEKQPAKASVVLKLKKASLAPEQVDSIRNFVAGAVEGLSPEQVTLVDADGRVNLAGHGGGVVQGDAEAAMEQKLIAMLEPLAGAGNVRATVNIAYDEGREERTDEVYDPAGSVPLSVDKKEQGGGGRVPASGVPGTASNAPAAAAAGAVAGSSAAAAEGTPPLLKKDALPVYPGGAAGGATMKEESGTYAVTKHFVHTEQGPGRVRRVTAAVVVNDREVAGEAGKPAVWRARTQEEMHRLELLAQGAVGFEEKRGDVVTLENVGFSSNVPEVKAVGAGKVLEEAKGLVAAQPGLARTAVLGLLGLLLVMFVLKPMASSVVATLKEPMLLERTETKLLKAQESTELPAPAEVPVGEKRFTAITGESVFNKVSEQVRKEPAQSTRLLQAWIGAAEEG